MAIRNYTSTVDPAKTAGQIQQRLSGYGAQRIALDYDGDGTCIAVTFTMSIMGEALYFRLEPDVDGTLDALERDPDVTPQYVNEAQAALQSTGKLLTKTTTR